LALVASAHAFDETRDPWIRGVFTGNSPRPLTLPESDAWRHVNELVRTTPDTFALVGSGQSMEPLYPPGTILVLRQVAFTELQRGQTAVYRNRSQRAVAHVLVVKCRDGWRVKGLNNATHDYDALVADNLVGVVVAAFTPAANSLERRVAAR
jgi:signal peptidase I